jgi:hypothetical protein
LITGVAPLEGRSRVEDTAMRVWNSFTMEKAPSPEVLERIEAADWTVVSVVFGRAATRSGGEGDEWVVYTVREV